MGIGTRLLINNSHDGPTEGRQTGPVTTATGATGTYQQDFRYGWSRNTAFFILVAENKKVSGIIREDSRAMTLCEVRTTEDITIVVMPLQIDHIAAMTLDHELQGLIAEKPTGLLLDCSHTKYISSSGLRIILKTAKAVKTGGGRFGVFAITPFVDHIFTMSGFSQLFSIYDTEEAAIRAVLH